MSDTEERIIQAAESVENNTQEPNQTSKSGQIGSVIKDHGENLLLIDQVLSHDMNSPSCQKLRSDISQSNLQEVEMQSATTAGLLSGKKTIAPEEESKKLPIHKTFTAVHQLPEDQAKAKDGESRQKYRERLENHNIKFYDKAEQEFNQRVQKCEFPEDYLNDLQRIIKLDDLYEIVRISNLTQESMYCSVVLKAKYQKYLNNSDESEDNYLLQCWTMQGQLVFQQWTVEEIKVMQIAENVLMYVSPSKDPFVQEDQVEVVIVRLDDKGKSTYIKVMVNNLSFEPNLLAWSKCEHSLLDTHIEEQRQIDLLLSPRTKSFDNSLTQEQFEKALQQDVSFYNLFLSKANSKVTDQDALMYLTINIGLFESALNQPDRCESVTLDAKSLNMPDDFKKSMENSRDGGELESSEILEIIALPQQGKILKKMNQQKDLQARRYFENRSIVVIAKQGRLAYYKLMGISSNGTAEIVDLVQTSEVHVEEEVQTQVFGSNKRKIIQQKNEIVYIHGRQAHFGVALLNNGGLQFYYNYRLVETETPWQYKGAKGQALFLQRRFRFDSYFDAEKDAYEKNQNLENYYAICINIETDFTGIYYRLRTKGPDIDSKTGQPTIRYLTMFTGFLWEHRIGHNTGKAVVRHGESSQGNIADLQDIKLLSGRQKSHISFTHQSKQLEDIIAAVDNHYTKKWYIIEQCMQRKMTQYVRLFNSFNIISEVLYIAHGNILSVYSLKDKQWTQHIEFSDVVRKVTRHKTTARVATQGVCVLVGTNQLHFYGQKREKTGRSSVQRFKVKKIIGHRVLLYETDRIYGEGIYMILEQTGPGRNGEKLSRMVAQQDEQGDDPLVFQPYGNKIKIESKALFHDLDKPVGEYGQFKELFFKRQRQQWVNNIDCQELINELKTGEKISLNLESDPRTEKDHFESSVLHIDSFKKNFQRNISLDFEKFKDKYVWHEVPNTASKKTGIMIGMIKSNLSQDGEEEHVDRLEIREKSMVAHQQTILKEVGDTIKRTKEFSFTGRNVRGYLHPDHSDNFWLYTLSDSHEYFDNREKNVEQIAEAEEDDGLHEKQQARHKASTGKFEPPGLYVYDMDKLIKGQIETHFLGDALGGLNSSIDFSRSSQGMSYLQSYNIMRMIPVVHRNVSQSSHINNVEKLLIWREEKGLFTFMDNTFKLGVVSIYDGTRIYTSAEKDLKQEQKQLYKKREALFTEFKLLDYRVYDGRFENDSLDKEMRGKFQDTYMRDNYTFEDYSLSLICRKIQIGKYDKKTEIQRNRGVFFKKNQSVHETYAQGMEGVTFDFIILKLSNGVCSVEAKFRKFLYLDTKGQLPLIFISRQKDIPGKFDLIVIERANQTAVKMILTPKKEKEGRAYLFDEMNCKTGEIIERFSYQLQKKTDSNFLFSPELDRFIDCDYKIGQFIIRSVSEKEKVHFKIPLSLFNCKLEGKTQLEGARRQSSRLKMISSNVIRMVSRFGIDVQFKFFDKIDNQEMREPVLQNECFISNFKNSFSARHAIMDKKYKNLEDTLDRLIDIYQNRKYLNRKLKQMNFDQEKINTLLAQTTFSVDYSIKDKKDTTDHKFKLQRSFTILDWLILNRVVADSETKTDDFDFESINTETKLSMCFNVLPNGRNVLHYFGDPKSPNINSLNILIDIFKSAKNSHNRRKYYIPFFEDSKGLTPLQLALTYGTADKNPRTNVAREFLTYLKYYPSGHFDDLLTLSLSDCLVKNVPGVEDFLKARLQKLPHLNEDDMRLKQMKSDLVKTTMKGTNYIACSARVYEDKQKIAQELLVPNGYNQVALEYRYLDLQDIHFDGDFGKGFFNALLRTNNEEIFNEEIVQILIDMKFYQAIKLIIGFQLAPYFLWILSFLIWSDLCTVPKPDLLKFWYGETEEEQLNNAYLWGRVFCYICFTFCFYFTIFELRMMYYIGIIQYFLQYQNFFDLVPIILNTILCIEYIKERENVISLQFGLISAICSVFLTMRAIIFMNLAPAYSRFISMLQYISQSITAFLGLVLILVLAFADGFNTVSRSFNENGWLSGQFGASIQYSYFTALGEFVQDSYSNEAIPKHLRLLAWIVFGISTLINFILILNLLISAVSATYITAIEMSTIAAYQAKAQIIRDMQGFFLNRKPVQHEALLICHETKDTVKISESVSIKSLMKTLKHTSNVGDETTHEIISLQKSMKRAHLKESSQTQQ